MTESSTLIVPNGRRGIIWHVGTNAKTWFKEGSKDVSQHASFTNLFLVWRCGLVLPHASSSIIRRVLQDMFSLAPVTDHTYGQRWCRGVLTAHQHYCSKLKHHRRSANTRRRFQHGESLVFYQSNWIGSVSPYLTQLTVTLFTSPCNSLKQALRRWNSSNSDQCCNYDPLKFFSLVFPGRADGHRPEQHVS